jgi:hypothetical protein
MEKSRAKKNNNDATREEREFEKAQQKKEKENNDFRMSGLKILGLVSKMKSRMLPEEAAFIQAIVEPYTQPIGSVARLKPEALANLVEGGDLVEDDEPDEDDEDKNERAASVNEVKLALTPSELRKDVTAALVGQGFKASEINASANKMNWSNGESLGEKLKAVLAMLRPSSNPEPNSASGEGHRRSAEGGSEQVEFHPEQPGAILPPTIPQRIKEQ